MVRVKCNVNIMNRFYQYRKAVSAVMPTLQPLQGGCALSMTRFLSAPALEFVYVSPQVSSAFFNFFIVEIKR